MFDSDGNTLYVGKAKNLRNRVTSYFRAKGLQTKTMAMVAKIMGIEITVTASEMEALLLEQNLIKRHSVLPTTFRCATISRTHSCTLPGIHNFPNYAFIGAVKERVGSTLPLIHRLPCLRQS